MKLSFGDSYAIIAIVGEQMRHTRGIAGRLFQALGANGIFSFTITLIHPAYTILARASLVPGMIWQRRCLPRWAKSRILNTSICPTLSVINTSILQRPTLPNSATSATTNKSPLLKESVSDYVQNYLERGTCIGGSDKMNRLTKYFLRGLLIFVPAALTIFCFFMDFYEAGYRLKNHF